MPNPKPLEDMLRDVHAWPASTAPETRELLAALVETVRAQDRRIGELERMVRGDGK